MLQLKLRKPKNKREVKWTTDTVDNEHLNKKKSKCESIISSLKISIKDKDILLVLTRQVLVHMFGFTIAQTKILSIYLMKNIYRLLIFCLSIFVICISGCCIYEKPRLFDESSSDESDDECRSCRGHKDKCFRTDKDEDPGHSFRLILFS